MTPKHSYQTTVGPSFCGGVSLRPLHGRGQASNITKLHAMQCAVLRLAHKGQPFATPIRDDDDVRIFVRWELRLARSAKTDFIVQSIKSAFDLVWQRADLILENSDSVLLLVKDTGPALDRLKRIQSKLEELG